jgi:hypothetical protein
MGLCSSLRVETSRHGMAASHPQTSDYADPKVNPLHQGVVEDLNLAGLDARPFRSYPRNGRLHVPKSAGLAGEIDCRSTVIGEECLLGSRSLSAAEPTPRYRREREVMASEITGLLNKQDAFDLSIIEFTVNAHRGRMMRKCRRSPLSTWRKWP